MKLLNFTTNITRTGHNLTQSQTTYDFDDIQVQLDTLLEVTIDGYVELSFDKDRDGYFIDVCEVEILNIYDSESVDMNLSKEILNQIKHEMQEELETQTIESH